MDFLSIKARWFIAGIISLIGLSASLVSGWDIVKFWTTSQTLLSLIANIYVLSLTFIIIIFASYKTWISIRKEPYANIAPLLHHVQHTIRDLETFLEERRPGESATKAEYELYLNSAKIKVIEVLSQTASIFRSITSTHFRACIKLIYPIEEELYCYTYARDQRSLEQCRTMDNNRVESDHDPLKKNNKFALLFSKNENQWHYFSNNLPSEDDFITTSITAYKPDYSNSITPKWKTLFAKHWPLPYKSTITCAIRQGPFQELPNRDSEVLGFLSIDSESRNVLEERWDVQVTFSVADALFQPIKKIIGVQRQAADAGFTVTV